MAYNKCSLKTGGQNKQKGIRFRNKTSVTTNLAVSEYTEGFVFPHLLRIPQGYECSHANEQNNILDEKDLQVTRRNFDSRKYGIEDLILKLEQI